MNKYRVIDWFKSVEDQGLRNKLLNNVEEHYENTNVVSLSEAISLGFIWDESPEGEQYWQIEAQKANNNEIRLNYDKLDVKNPEPSIKNIPDMPNPYEDNYLERLRDKFAMAAMQPLLTYWTDILEEDVDLQSIAIESYEMADAMLAERSRNERD